MNYLPATKLVHIYSLLLKKICPKIFILYMASYQIFEEQKKEKEMKYQEQREIANHAA